jgi:hypothetical protein
MLFSYRRIVYVNKKLLLLLLCLLGKMHSSRRVRLISYQYVQLNLTSIICFSRNPFRRLLHLKAFVYTTVRMSFCYRKAHRIGRPIRLHACVYVRCSSNASTVITRCDGLDPPFSPSRLASLRQQFGARPLSAGAAVANR